MNVGNKSVHVIGFMFQPFLRFYGNFTAMPGDVIETV